MDNTGRIAYLQILSMVDSAHRIDVVVTSANAANQFIVDSFITFGIGSDSISHIASSPTATSSGLPIAATHSVPIGAIFGGVVGGIVSGIAVLVVALCCFWKRSTRSKPGPGGALVDKSSYMSR